jgi:hypothetical protein
MGRKVMFLQSAVALFHMITPNERERRLQETDFTAHGPRQSCLCSSTRPRRSHSVSDVAVPQDGLRPRSERSKAALLSVVHLDGRRA